MRIGRGVGVKVALWALVILMCLAAGRIGYVICGQTELVKKAASADTKKELYTQLELFGDALGIIRTDFVDEVGSQKLIYGALKGLLLNLDSYSQFLEPDDFKEIKVETKGEFGGIGIEINIRKDMLTILKPMAGGPAEKAGMMADDKIIAIDGESTKTLSLDEAVKRLRGDPGTKVRLTIWREKDDKLCEFTLTRQVIKIDSIKKAELLEEKIGYIKMEEFQERTPLELEAALERLNKEGMDSLILDLRNNPGGLLDIAVSVSEKFLPPGAPIVSTKSRVKNQNMEFKANCPRPHTDFPMVVMVNRWSASASEITAGAIQDNKRGLVLGVKTFGKGSVQTVIPLRDGSALRLTTASYYTPQGKSIRDNGIIPDVVVERELFKERRERPMDIFDRIEEDKEKKTFTLKPKPEKEGRDNQLEQAINLIKGLKAYSKTQAPGAQPQAKGG